ncbi:11286_t:CDS:2 [Ambispora gerdemannii]|uniref:Large ribosomal subunit protein uL2m n=1 Tax=Ambispora gerdemannii TaxID=144530 RepID=A0A9N8WF19_9GLOM|nr:11286_t:CDS:2 [Ambispora gerdemannii]
MCDFCDNIASHVRPTTSGSIGPTKEFILYDQLSDKRISRLATRQKIWNSLELTKFNPDRHLNFSKIIREYATSAPGQFKTYKPVSPGRRWLRRPINDHLFEGRPVKKLTIPLRKSGGRNEHGHITVRHRGGGHKRRIRLVDFKRWDPGPQEVLRIEYDPNRSGHIALLKHKETRKLSYILSPHGLEVGSIVQSFPTKTTSSYEEEIIQDPAISRMARITKGNCLPLRMIPVGTLIHCVGLKPNGAGILCRAAGTSAQVVQTGEKGYAQIRLKSGEVRLIHVECCGTIGTVSNPDHQHRMLGKAGRSRWLGRRPTVRGVAMNSVDHPHGGGRGKSKSNRHPVSPWGVLAKGGKTRRKPNKWVVKQRARR